MKEVRNKVVRKSTLRCSGWCPWVAGSSLSSSHLDLQSARVGECPSLQKNTALLACYLNHTSEHTETSQLLTGLKQNFLWVFLFVLLLLTASGESNSRGWQVGS